MSFGTIGLGVGSVLLVLGFLGYFNFLKGLDNSLSALLLIYGFPITLIGVYLLLQYIFKFRSIHIM